MTNRSKSILIHPLQHWGTVGQGRAPGQLCLHQKHHLGPGRAPGLEVRVRDGGQLLKERYDRPDLLIGHTRRTKTWHSRHPDAVLDYPEQLYWSGLAHDVLEIGRAGIEALGEFGPGDPRATMTIDASTFQEGVCARTDDIGIVERAGWCCTGMSIDRSLANVLQ